MTIPSAEQESKRKDVSIYRRTAVIVLIVAALLGIFRILWELRVLVIDVLLAITVASAIAPVAEKCEKHRIPRFLTVLSVYVLVGLFYAAVFWALASPLKEQSLLLAQQLPHFSDMIRDAWSEVLSLLGDKAALIELHATDFREPAMNLAKKTLDTTAGIMGLAANGVLVLFLAAYFVAEAKEIVSNLLLWVPPEFRPRIAALVAPLGAKMGGYVRGQLLVSTAVACFFGAAFTAIGLKYGLVLGLVAGVLNLIPYVGSLFATVLALFVASTQSLLVVGLTLAVFAIEQVVESQFIVPHLLGRQVDMHPLVVMFAILIGGSLAGGVGALAAVPLAGAILLLIGEFYVKPINNIPGVAQTPKPVVVSETPSEGPVAVINTNVNTLASGNITSPVSTGDDTLTTTGSTVITLPPENSLLAGEGKKPEEDSSAG